MSKENMADKMAKIAYESPKFQQAWALNMQAFGPILEPAFVENYPARIHLVDMMNLFSQKKLDEGRKKLKLLEKFCHTDADEAAWLFSAGLACDIAGDHNGMLHYYRLAEEKGHRFFLPYLKMAAVYMKQKAYDSADEYFHKSLECQKPEDLRTQMVYCSTLVNHARCLMGMHRYDRALEQLEKAWNIAPGFNGLCNTRVMVYAAMGDMENYNRYLRDLRILDPRSAEQTEKMAKAILEGKDSHYAPGRIDDAAIADFWTWFQSADLNAETLPQAIQPHLQPIFPELPKEYVHRVTVEEDTVILAMFYNATLEEGYRRLLAAMPQGLSWKFDIIY